MGLVIQHNMAALNALNNLNANISGLQEATARLSSGFQINRAADNAAGLAISEKMRSQIRGLNQAVRNANDAISLIQTAEGGLNESHAILQRMRELAVQSANGTYTEDDRAAIQLEVDALKDEINRISGATEYNTMKLLDGSLSGSGGNNGEYGALYGSVDTLADIGGGRITTTSNVAGIQLEFTSGASGKGGENAVWSDDGKKLTVNLVKGKSYNDADIQKLIDNAAQPKSLTGAGIPNVTFKSEYGVIQGPAADTTTTATVAGVRQTATADIKDLVGNGSGAVGSSDTITFTANRYGNHTTHPDTLLQEIQIAADRAAGKEEVTVDTAATSTAGAKVTLHLATGKSYSEKDIEKLLKKAGYDYTVKLTDSTTPDGSKDGTVYFNKSGTSAGKADLSAATNGSGVGKEYTANTGEGLTFQIGANGSEDQQLTMYIDDMGASALGIDDVDVSDRDSANKAIDTIDDAIKKVSMQRAALGAQHNRLEYTVSSLTTAAENLTDAESRIRDTDMAKEMMKYTKYNILMQAAQAMLAQAMQQPQSVLQLLG